MFFNQCIKYIGRIFACQKRLLRILMKLKPKESDNGRFKEGKLLTVHARMRE